MKNIITTFLIATFTLLTITAYAQGNPQQKGKPEAAKGQEKKESAAEATKRPPHEKVGKPSTPPGKDKEHPGQGNAFGKDKGDMSGREFGQQRAAEARNKKEESAENIRIAIDKLTDARIKLEEKMKRKEISQKDYEEKMKQIEEATEEVATLKEEYIKAEKKIDVKIK